MRVLITYATAHGSTKGVATEIGGRLAASGLSVDVLPAEGVGSLDGYDAVVIGSAVHNGAWLPPASSLIDHHVDELASRPVWLFSVSSVGESSSFFGARVAAVMRRMRGSPGRSPPCAGRSGPGRTACSRGRSNRATGVGPGTCSWRCSAAPTATIATGSTSMPGRPRSRGSCSPSTDPPRRSAPWDLLRPDDPAPGDPQFQVPAPNRRSARAGAAGSPTPWPPVPR